MSPADLADLRRQTPKRQNSINLKQSVFLCVIMQLCCIPLRNLRNLRENIHIRGLNQSAGEDSHENTQSICTNETPMSPADLADLRRRNPKQQNSLNLKLSVFLCEIIQLSCIRLRDLRNLRENNHARVLKQFAQRKQ